MKERRVEDTAAGSVESEAEVPKKPHREAINVEKENGRPVRVPRAGPSQIWTRTPKKKIASKGEDSGIKPPKFKLPTILARQERKDRSEWRKKLKPWVKTKKFWWRAGIVVSNVVENKCTCG